MIRTERGRSDRGGGSISPKAIFDTFPQLWALAASGKLRIDTEQAQLADVEAIWRGKACLVGGLLLSRNRLRSWRMSFEWQRGLTRCSANLAIALRLRDTGVVDQVAERSSLGFRNVI